MGPCDEGGGMGVWHMGRIARKNGAKGWREKMARKNGGGVRIWGGGRIAVGGGGRTNLVEDATERPDVRGGSIRRVVEHLR